MDFVGAVSLIDGDGEGVLQDVDAKVGGSSQSQLEDAVESRCGIAAVVIHCWYL